jgi:two-component system CheB/CheR fusion protein
MMPPIDRPGNATEFSKLLDENEQLRTALESALEENAEAIEDRDRLLRRVAVLAREMKAMDAARAGPASVQPSAPLAETEAQATQNQTEEELRVAFEELQVLAEELEVANAGLLRANEELDERVRVRTRELTAANADLRRTDLRLNTLIEGMPQLVWRAIDGGMWTWCSPQWREYTGLPQDGSAQLGWLYAFHPDDRPVALEAWEQAPRAGGLTFEGRICHASSGRYRHFQTRASPVRADDGQVLEWLGTCTDVDDLIRLREQQDVLVAELQHRTRNLMTVVYAVVMRTMKGSRSLDDFRRCIDDRLAALARVQGLLSRRGSQRISFDRLLREELSAHVDLNRDGGAQQVSLAGPADVALETSQVQTFALALHELATNAVKYGALSTPDGLLSVQWELVQSEKRKPRLHVDWRESGVADVPEPGAAPRGSGYGRELIERALPYQLGASTTYGFTGDGVRCTIEIDVPSDEVRKERVHARI